MALGARHAGRGLVEQQHLGPEAERDGQLDQPLAAVGQLGMRRLASSASFSDSSSSIASSTTSRRRPAGRSMDGAAPTRSATAM